MVRLRSPAPYGGFPEWPKGADCKSVVSDFGGPNPPAPTKKPASLVLAGFSVLRTRILHEFGEMYGTVLSFYFVEDRK